MIIMLITRMAPPTSPLPRPRDPIETAAKAGIDPLLPEVALIASKDTIRMVNPPVPLLEPLGGRRRHDIKQ